MKRFSFLIPVLLVFAFSGIAFAQVDTESLLRKSAEYEKQDRLDEAIGEITKAIAIKPEMAALYLRRSELYRFQNKNELVATDVNKAVELNTSDRQTTLEAARLLTDINRCAESLNILNNYIFSNSESDDVFYSRAHTQMCLGDWASAYADISKASELNPQNNHYRTTQAGVLAKLGNAEQSEAKFSEMLKNLTTKLTQSRIEEEKESVKRQLAEVYRGRAGAFHLKTDTSAEFADLAKFIEYSPRDFNYRYRAKIYRDHQMYDEAIADYTAAIKLSPNIGPFLLERGDVLAEAKRYEEALKDYEQAIKLDNSLKELIERRITRVRARLN